MLILAETNFVLELAFARDAHVACRSIVRMAEEGALTLVLPIVAVVEPYYALVGRHRRRRRLYENLQAEINELARSQSYADLGETARESLVVLIGSTEGESTSLNDMLAEVLGVVCPPETEPGRMRVQRT